MPNPLIPSRLCRILSSLLVGGSPLTEGVRGVGPPCLSVEVVVIIIFFVSFSCLVGSIPLVPSTSVMWRLYLGKLRTWFHLQLAMLSRFFSPVDEKIKLLPLVGLPLHRLHLKSPMEIFWGGADSLHCSPSPEPP